MTTVTTLDKTATTTATTATATTTTTTNCTTTITNTTTTAPQLQLQLHLRTTPRHTKLNSAVVGDSKKAQPKPHLSPSVDSLRHPCISAIYLCYTCLSLTRGATGIKHVIYHCEIPACLRPRYVQDIHGTGLWLRTVARSLLDGKQGAHHPRGSGHAVKDTVGQGKLTFLKRILRGLRREKGNFSGNWMENTSE